MCILLSHRRSVNIVAKEDTTLMVYPVDELENLIANRPGISIHIIETLVERLNKTTEELKAVTKELVGKQICTVDYSNISTWF